MTKHGEVGGTFSPFGYFSASGSGAEDGGINNPISAGKDPSGNGGLR